MTVARCRSTEKGPHPGRIMEPTGLDPWSVQVAHACSQERQGGGRGQGRSAFVLRDGTGSVLLHCACTASAPWQLLVVKQTPVHHSKMHPPKQPIEPEKSLVASTRPVFLGFPLMIANTAQRLLRRFCYFLEASGGFQRPFITRRVPRYTQSLHCAHHGKSALGRIGVSCVSVSV